MVFHIFETKTMNNGKEIRQALSQAGFSDIEFASDQETFYLKRRRVVASGLVPK
jgi:hypothetical protein